MLKILFLVVSMAGYVSLFAKAARISVGESLLSIFCSIGVILYFGSLFGYLSGTATVLLYGGVAASVYLTVRTKLRILSLKDNIFTFGILFGFLVFGLYWLQGYQFLGWDEFSHWALVAKYLISENKLFTADSQILFLAYPPGTALFQYYFAQVMGPAESSIIFAHMSLLFAAMLAVIGNSSRKPLLAICLLLLCFVALYGLGYDIYEIYVDLTLGTLLGASLAILLARQNEARGYVAVIPILMFLPLVKHVGFAFSMVGLGAMFVVAIYDLRNLPNRNDRVRVASCVVAAMLGVALTQISWHAYYISLGVPDRYARVVTVSNLVEFFSNPTSNRHILVWSEFFKRMLSEPATNKLYLLSPLSEIMILLAVTLVHLWFVPTATRLRQILIFSVVVAGLFAFTCLLLLSYGFYFTDYEGVRLASFERYLGSFLLVWALVLVGAAGQRMALKQHSNLAYIIFIPFLILAFLSIPKVKTELFTEQGNIKYKELSGLRDISKKLTSEIQSVAKDTQKTYFIDPYSTGYTFFMFRYDMAPMEINPKCWVLRAPSSKDDIYACDLPLDKALEGYDFLALGKVNVAFWERYSNLFSPEDRGISPASFAVIRYDGRMELKRLKKE